MAAAVVQAKSAQSAGTGSVACAMASSPTAGNLLVALCANNTGTVFGTGAVTDTRSNTWNRVVTQAEAGLANNVAIFYAIANASASLTVTLTAAGGTDFPTLAVYEVSGNDPTPSDLSTGNQAATGTAHSTGTTGTTNQADEIVFVCDTHAGGTSTPSVTVGYTLGTAGQGLETNSANQPLATAYKVVAATGTQTATFTWQNAGWSAVIATFKAAAGGAVTGFMTTNTGYWGI